MILKQLSAPNFLIKDAESRLEFREELMLEIQSLLRFLWYVEGQVRLRFWWEDNCVQVGYLLANVDVSSIRFHEQYRYLQLSASREKLCPVTRLSCEDKTPLSSLDNGIRIGRRLRPLRMPGTEKLFKTQLIPLPFGDKQWNQEPFLLPVPILPQWADRVDQWRHTLAAFRRLALRGRYVGGLAIDACLFAPLQSASREQMNFIAYAQKNSETIVRALQQQTLGMNHDVEVPGPYGEIATGTEMMRVEIAAVGPLGADVELASALIADIDPGVLEIKRPQNKIPTVEALEGFTQLLEELWTIEDLPHLMCPPYSLRDALPGVENYVPKPFLVPELTTKARKDSNKQQPQQKIELGSLVDKTPILMDVNELTRHMFVTGTPGSGKTNMLFRILKQIPANIPFLVIDPAKREYRKLFSKLGMEGNIVSFQHINEQFEQYQFNPFVVPDGIPVYDHAHLLANCFSLLYPTTQGASALLHNMMTVTYYRMWFDHKKKDPDYDRNSKIGEFIKLKGENYKDCPDAIPTYDDFYKIGMWHIRQLGRKQQVQPASQSGEQPKVPTEQTAQNTVPPTKSDKSDWMRQTLEHFERRFEVSEYSVFTRLISPADKQASAEKFFRSSHLLELEFISDPKENSALIALIVSLLYEYRRSTWGDGEQQPLHHVTVLEEAHRIVPGRARVQSADAGVDPQQEVSELFARLLAEIRAMGEGLILVEQSPTKLIPDVMINTSTKIILRTLYGADKEALADALSLSTREEEYLSFLRIGEALILLSDAQQPVYATVPDQKDKIASYI